MVRVRTSREGALALTERRLHVSDLPPEGGEVTLDAVASRHVRVLRLRPGDAVLLFDGRGQEAQAEVQSVDESVICMAKPSVTVEADGPRVVLVLGLPKGGTLDDCVRMATELGAHEVALLQAERSVPRWDEARTRSRVERLTRIAAEASAQCERSDVPTIHPPRSADQLFEAMPPGAGGVVFGARAERRFAIAEAPEQLWCAVGPEGGFSDPELRAFEAAGFEVASLGPTVLRVDTAVAAALTVVGERMRSLQAR